MSDPLRPHGLQHARLPCPPISPSVCSSLCPLSWWSYPTISTSVTHFLSFPHPFPRVFSNEFSIWWSKYWSFSFRVSPSREYSELNSFRIESESRSVMSDWCLTLCDPVNYTVCGILQARILEWVAFPFSRGSSQPRDQTQVFHIVEGFFTSWSTRKAVEYWSG